MVGSVGHPFMLERQGGMDCMSSVLSWSYRHEGAITTLNELSGAELHEVTSSVEVRTQSCVDHLGVDGLYCSMATSSGSNVTDILRSLITPIEQIDLLGRR